MPTSNGLITARDIRQKAVKTIHIIDEAVTTSKIPDLAVTYPDKLDDPVWVHVAEGSFFHNVSLTTTSLLVSTVSVDIPAWVNQIYVLAFAKAQFSNTSGGAQTIVISLGFEGEAPSSGAEHQSAANLHIASVTQVQTYSTSGVAGSTFTVEMYADLLSNTNSANNGEAHALILGFR